MINERCPVDHSYSTLMPPKILTHSGGWWSNIQRGNRIIWLSIWLLKHEIHPVLTTTVPARRQAGTDNDRKKAMQTWMQWKGRAEFLADGAICRALLRSTHRPLQMRQKATVPWSPCNFFSCLVLTLSTDPSKGQFVELELWIGSFRSPALHEQEPLRWSHATYPVLPHWKQVRECRVSDKLQGQAMWWISLREAEDIRSDCQANLMTL